MRDKKGAISFFRDLSTKLNAEGKTVAALIRAHDLDVHTKLGNFLNALKIKHTNSNP